MKLGKQQDRSQWKTSGKPQENLIAKPDHESFVYLFFTYITRTAT